MDPPPQCSPSPSMTKSPARRRVEERDPKSIRAGVGHGAVGLRPEDNERFSVLARDEPPLLDEPPLRGGQAPSSSPPSSSSSGPPRGPSRRPWSRRSRRLECRRPAEHPSRAGASAAAGPWASSSDAPCASGAAAVSEEPLLRRRNFSPSKGAGGLRFAFGAGASSDDDSPSKGGAGRAFFAGGGFVGRASSSDESLSRMDLAFFFFAEAGAAAGAGAGAGAAAPAAAAPPRLGGGAALLVAAPS